MIFLDSSFLVALEVETDENHEKAAEIVKKIVDGSFGEAFISDYVFDETVTVTFLKTKNLSKANLVGDNLRLSTNILRIDENIFDISWEIFKTQKNTKFSFTDCTNLAIMKDNEIKNIATFDKDFKEIEDIKIID